MAYRGAIFNQNVCPMVHQIKGNLYEKLKFLTQETDIVAYSINIQSMLVHWIRGKFNAKNQGPDLSSNFRK